MRGSKREKNTKDMSVYSVCVSSISPEEANLNRIRGSSDGLFTVNYTVL